MKSIIIIIFVLLLTACSKSHQPLPSTVDGKGVESYDRDNADSLNEVILQNVKEDVAPEKKSARSISSSSSNDNYDNMRGFDPASEDDMDDNGMSRYMENNDEEGWD